MRRRTWTGAVMALALAAAVGCDDATGPAATPGTGTLTLSVGVGGGAAGAGSPGLFAADLELTDGANTLVITSAEVVLREIELERLNDDDCDDIPGDDDDCEEFEVGPLLVSLPVDGGVAHQITATVDTGTYDEIEFEVHKLDDDDPRDQELLAQDPALDDISIRVAGTFNGEEFVYISDLNEDQEVELGQPLVIMEDSGPVNLTLTLDISTWFRGAGGGLIDPRTALKGGPNENLVEDRIEASIEGFRDDDLDGRDDDEDDDDGFDGDNG